MITKFIEYNENFEIDSNDNATEFQKTMVELFKKRYNFKTNLEVYLNDDGGVELVNNTLEEDDVHPMSVGYVARIEYDGDEYMLSGESTEIICDNKEDLIAHTIKYLDAYEKDYYNYLNEYDITKVIVFNPNDFSKFILDDIVKNKNKDNKYLKKLKKVTKYLNDYTKSNLGVYIKASKYNI
jgi:hypothetical protein